MGYKICKIAQQLEADYYPVGENTQEISQEEAPEELNEVELIVVDEENCTPGTDNIVIDKMDSYPINIGAVLAKLKHLAILTKSGYAHNLLLKTIAQLESIKGDY